LDEVGRRRSTVLARQTDAARWLNRDSYEDHWNDRAIAVAGHLTRAAWVCDLGCGQQALRRALPAGISYLPADLRAWTPDTARCDLNAGLMPVRYLRACDTVTMLGVLEYIFDPAALLRRLACSAESIVLTYCAVDLWDADRAGYGWVNGLRVEDLRVLLQSVGYSIEITDIYQGRQIIMRGRQRLSFMRRMLRHSERLRLRLAAP